MSEGMHLVLKAPLSGIIVPLDAVPDPVFAGKMVGDGLSIDPVTASLLAPCDGRVVQIHSAAHAVTVARDGVEILMHIGIDTVQLKGQGFTPRVRAGDAVRAGDVLIDFDADFVATHARSLLTQIIVTSTDRVAAMEPATGAVTAGTDTILDVTLTNGLKPGGPAAGESVRSEPIVVTNPSGLHARPAAMLASRAKQFEATIHLRRGDQEVNARSVVAIMGLEIAHGDRVEIVASGRDAGEAVQSLSQLIRDGLGEGTSEPEAPAAPAADIVRPSRSDDPDVLVGVGEVEALGLQQHAARIDRPRLADIALGPVAVDRLLQDLVAHVVAVARWIEIGGRERRDDDVAGLDLLRNFLGSQDHVSVRSSMICPTCQGAHRFRPAQPLSSRR